MSKKRTYKCGGCGELGHNKRTCPSKKGATAKTEPAKAAPAPVEKTEVKEEAAPEAKPQFALEGSTDLTAGRRESAGKPAVPAAPYDCPACNQVAILVLVELHNGQTALRCEKCQNSSPVTKILKWGAFPKDKPPEKWQRRASLI